MRDSYPLCEVFVGVPVWKFEHVIWDGSDKRSSSWLEQCKLNHCSHKHIKAGALYCLYSLPDTSVRVRRGLTDLSSSQSKALFKLCPKRQYTESRACVPTHRRLLNSAGRSSFISLLYFFTCASRTKLIFITCSMYLKTPQTEYF